MRGNPIRSVEPVPMTVATRIRSALTLAVTLTFFTSCVSLEGATPEARRASALTVHDEVLGEAREDFPELPEVMEGAVGYVTFDSGIFKTIIGHVGGYAVAVDLETDERTVLASSAWCLGPLFEFGTARGLAIVNDRQVFDAIVAGEVSWDFGADADASFRFGDFGGDVSATSFNSEAKFYRMFQTGVGLNACVFWMSLTPVPELNP